jgi:serine protease AprX
MPRARALRLITLVAVLVAGALGAPTYAAASHGGPGGGDASPGTGADDCPATDTVCFDKLPADSTWERAINLPAVPRKYKGDGVTVASIDTGVAPNPDLGARLLARVDLTSEHDGIDRFGHGTHMAGLIAGDGTTSAEAFEGAAPETNLVSVKVAGWDGATDSSTVIAALQWAVSNKDRYGIRVINLSWGTDAPRGYGDDPLDLAVERAWRAGIVVVVAAGNSGPTPGTVTKPGDDPLVLTVGADDTQGTADVRDDAVAAFSSRGPTADGLQKPDVLAPGISLVSDRVTDSTVDAFRPAARLGTALFKGSGTSQAAAITSGVIARMLEANPQLTPDQVKGVLMATATPVPGPGAGAGLINAGAAAAAVVAPKDGFRVPLPKANAGVVASTGTGTIAGSRGSFPVVRDLDGDGIADALTSEVDALGLPWDSAAYAAATWSAATWAASPWAPVTAVIAGSQPAPPWSGPAVAPVAWEATYWGAPSWQLAGWDAKYWGAKYWGAKYWGTGLWQ